MAGLEDELEPLRAIARSAYQAAVAAVQPCHLLRAVLRRSGSRIEVRDVALPRVPGRRVVVALGKAAPTLAEAWLELLPDWTHEALVITPHGVPVSPRVAAFATVLRGAHPYPDAAGEASARRLLELVAGLGDGDLLLVLLSGGASALLTAPHDGLLLEDVHATTRSLLTAGAPITAVNTVRRQLLAAAGGGLARSAFPARVMTLVLSDVLGDPLPDIASGPTVPSPTTAGDALAVLERFGVVPELPQRVLAFLTKARQRRQRADRRWHRRSRTVVLANNGTAVSAAAGALRRDGCAVVEVRRPLLGDARARGEQLGTLAAALQPRASTALVLGGETTVTVRGGGRGGRCQELALAAAFGLAGATPCALLAAGTDGIDGHTDHAGAIVDPTSLKRLAAAGIDASAALAHNDSGTALATIGDAIVIGPTGTNVCDLVILVTR